MVKNILIKFIIILISTLSFQDISFSMTLENILELERLRETSKEMDKKEVEKLSNHKFLFYTDKEIEDIIKKYDNNGIIWVDIDSDYYENEHISTISTAKYKQDLCENYKEIRDKYLNTKKINVYNIEHCTICGIINVIGFGKVDINPDKSIRIVKGSTHNISEYCVRCFNDSINNQFIKCLYDYTIDLLDEDNNKNENRQQIILDWEQYLREHKKDNDK